MAEHTPILTEQQGGILTITLNRPEKLNAMTDPMLEGLLEALKQAERDSSVRVVILTGAGRGFCPGQDLGAAQERGNETGDYGYGKHLRETYNLVILRMRRLSKPIIGAINGPAAGAGMSIALACDLRVAAESAIFVQAFVKIGLVPDSGATWLLPRLIGQTRAMELMFTGRKVSAQEALELGMIHQVVADDQLMPTVYELAETLANAATKAIGYIKRGLEFAATHTLEESLEYEADLQDMAGRTADHHEGLTAFLEKRPPQYRGE
ncbi:MAG: 2-(1,2-epoxy-1,2-dihydrophenyl)acetyl-CoA isomerase [Chloroflexota bacterium]|nr:MAG: 2-(1,2-epoxy-1,2-dihydrophenyl)acetyl-CoA isomerase [Chloroflexota bacterium]